MLDVAMTAHLLRALPLDARLYLVGNPNQLSSPTRATYSAI